MAIYHDKGLEELEGKLDAFSQLFKQKTGTELTRDELKLALEVLYDQKRKQLITQAFGTETVTTLNRFLVYFEELFPKPPEPEPFMLIPEPEKIELQAAPEKTKKRKSK